jgi:hypothetical protein
MIENFQLFLNVVVYFLNFSGIICMMFVITSNFSYFTMVGQVFSNWSLGFIEDVKAIEKIKSEKEPICPENYEYLVKFPFPGTKSGCNCLNIFNMTGYTEFENKLLPGSCSLMLIKLGCRTVADLPSKAIHSIEDKFYCIRRGEFNYLEKYQESVYESICPIGKKSCGEVDSLMNILCVREEEACPFLGHKKGNNSYIDLYRQKIDYEKIGSIKNENKFTHNNQSIALASALALNNEYYLISDMPEIIHTYSKFYVQFTLSQGNVCINNDEINLYMEEIHELFNTRRSMKCSTQLYDNNPKFRYDFRYTPIVIFNTSSIFYKEEFILTNLETLAKFPKSYFSSPMILSGRNYIGWNKKCKNYITQFQSMHKLSQQIEGYSIFYLIYSLVMLIYCMLFIMIFKELIYEQYTLKIFIILVHVVMIMIIFFLVLADYLEITRAVDLCFLIIKKRCSDEETNRLILFVLDVFKDIARLYMITLILDVIMILLSAVKVLLTVYKIYKRAILARLVQGRTNEFEMMLLM